MLLPDRNPIHKVAQHFNKTDNRAYNLEMMTNSRNSSNRQKTSKHTSKYLGVSWHKSWSKWRARIYHNRKEIDIGRFDTEEEAAKGRDNYIQDKGLDHMMNFESKN